MQILAVIGCGLVAATLVIAVEPNLLERLALMLFARAKAIRAGRKEYSRVVGAGIAERTGTLLVCGRRIEDAEIRAAGDLA